MEARINNIGVIGAGIMGIGIVQIAIQANHPVYLYDAQPNAAKNAYEKLTATFSRLVEKNKISQKSSLDAHSAYFTARRRHFGVFYDRIL